MMTLRPLVRSLKLTFTIGLNPESTMTEGIGHPGVIVLTADLLETADVEAPIAERALPMSQDRGFFNLDQT